LKLFVAPRFSKKETFSSELAVMEMEEVPAMETEEALAWKRTLSLRWNGLTRWRAWVAVIQVSGMLAACS
jgi:hypothetical protein